jgi:hypothetical protein
MDRTRTDRKWSVLAVLAVAIVLMLAVPLANRALGAEPDAPGCGIAPWTGTCTCLMSESSTATTYEEFARALRQAARAGAPFDPETLLITARRLCHLEARSALRE